MMYSATQNADRKDRDICIMLYNQGVIMDVANGPRRFGRHRNALGFLRLLFASLVIISHTAEYMDGDRGREPLTRLFGSISFGELAVGGFFIISGFLISLSYTKSRSIIDYLVKRIARIYPGFAVASVVTVFLFAPLAGGVFPDGAGHALLGCFRNIVTLQLPWVPSSFAGQPRGELNGAMWTISYEFRCYLLVILLGLAGLLRRPAMLAAASAGLLALYGFAPDALFDPLLRVPHPELVFGTPRDLCRMTGLFLAGAAFRGWQHIIPVDGRVALTCATALVATLCVPALATFGVAIFGTYLIFWSAVAATPTFLGRLNDRNDISYGLYLYASPIINLQIRYFPYLPLIVVMVASWIAAAALGLASWLLIEKPVMGRIRGASRI
jgi:peptidoglycan/LPS O-acetylase OafA/YrhL